MNKTAPTIFSMAVCAMLMLGTCSAALAGATAGTRIDGVHLGVLDLTPGDGRAAGFDIVSFDSRLIVYTDTRATGGAFARQIVHPAAHAPGNAELGTGATLAGADTTGAVGNIGARASTPAALGLDNTVSGESEQRLWLTLKPHSLLTVSGTVLTEAWRTLGPDEGYRVFTWAAVDIADTDMLTTSYLTRESALIWGEATTAARNEEAFLLAFANPGTTEMAVSVNFMAYADIAVAAVPEPGAATMLGAGLLVMLGLCRRRGHLWSRATG
jgi:hypothetical protein